MFGSGIAACGRNDHQVVTGSRTGRCNWSAVCADFPRHCLSAHSWYFSVCSEGFTVISRYFEQRFRCSHPKFEVPNPAVDMDSWAGSACYPRGSFYPISHGPSTRDRRITLADFRPCSTCTSCSQAPLCQCTRRVIAIHPEGTVARLRYLLGGDRPSQTAYQALSPRLLAG